MARELKSKFLKSSFYITKYPKEFILGTNNNLLCNICSTSVSSERKSCVDSHRKTKKHVEGLEAQKSSPRTFQSYLRPPANEAIAMVVKAFVSADIPLYKLNNTKIQELFKFAKLPNVSESSARRQIIGLAENHLAKLVEYFQTGDIFIVFDETEIKRKKYINILAGLVEKPEKILCIECIVLHQNICYSIVIETIYNSLDKINASRDRLVLIISDAATYMVKAVRQMKTTRPNLLHITCLAHLLHNCAIRIKSFYKDVDSVIASLKALTIKNKATSSLFAEIGKPPNVIITRWSSWLRAINYYCDHLPKIKEIVSQLQNDGILAKNAKKSLESKNLLEDLVQIKSCYMVLVKLLDGLEKSKYDAKSAYEAVKKLDFQEDLLNIKSYISSRLLENDISVIVEMKNTNLSPSLYCLLQKCPPTSIAVERSFSMLKKLLAMDRNFDEKNIYKYFCFYYNTQMDD